MNRHWWAPQYNKRNLLIGQLWDEGTPFKEIAERVGLSVARCRHVAQKYEMRLKREEEQNAVRDLECPHCGKKIDLIFKKV